MNFLNMPIRYTVTFD